MKRGGLTVFTEGIKVVVVGEGEKWQRRNQSRVKGIKVESSVLKQSQVYTSQAYQKEKAQEHLHVDVESVEPAL